MKALIICMQNNPAYIFYKKETHKSASCNINPSHVATVLLPKLQFVVSGIFFMSSDQHT